MSDSQSLLIFLLFAALSVGSVFLGRRLGRDSATRAGVFVTLCLLVMAAWAFMIRQPAIALQAVPASVLKYLEGTFAVPLFMVIVGIAWSRCTLPRQKRATVLAGVFGLILFVHGGLWMVQQTPDLTPRESTKPTGIAARHTVMQSEPYTCVPAATATALRMIGMPPGQTTEAQLAYMTQTRPGTGSTMIRAVDALEQALAGSNYSVNVVATDYESMCRLPMPMLASVHFGSSTYTHMVVIVRASERGIMVMDPTDGGLFITREEFEENSNGTVIVFDRNFSRRIAHAR